jgi:hypothetical protein
MRIRNTRSECGSATLDQIPLQTISVADPGSDAFLTPGSGMGKNSRSGSSDHVSESLETIFSSLKILKFFYADQIRNLSDPGSGMEKFGFGITIPDPQHCRPR